MPAFADPIEVFLLHAPRQHHRHAQHLAGVAAVVMLASMFTMRNRGARRSSSASASPHRNNFLMW